MEFFLLSFSFKCQNENVIIVKSMKNKMKAERTLFLKRIHQELKLMFEMYGALHSAASIRLMKQIVKQLEYEIHLGEMERIRKQVADGKLTPKEAVKKKAVVRKKYRG